LDDPVFLVTSASSGLGLELVSRLSSLGRRVVAADLDNHRLEEAARRAAWPMSQVRLFALDVRQPAQWAAGFALGARAFGGIDVLLHAAGRPPPDADGRSGEAAAGEALGIRAAAAHMAPRGGGRVVLLHSLEALAPCPGQACPGQGAVRAGALSAEPELSSQGVALTVVYAAPAKAGAEVQDGWLADSLLSRALGRPVRELALAPGCGVLARLLEPWPALAALLWRRRQRRGARPAAAARTHVA